MDATQNAPASSDLSEYGALLRRRWWVVAVCALVGLLAGGGLLLVQPKVYSSTTQIDVKDAPGGGEQGQKNKVNLDTEAAIMQSSKVAEKAKALLKADLTPSELQDRIDVDAVPNSSVLAVTYRASNPGAAQQGATSYAQAYLNFRSEQFRASAASQIKAYRQQTATLNNDLRQVTTQRRQLPANSPERPVLLLRQNSITEQIAGLGEKIALLQGQAVEPGSIISEARPGRQTSPIMPLFVGSGLMVGLLLGVVMALWRDRADVKLRSADDVQRLLNMPVLLNVPVKGKAPMGLLPSRSQGGQAFHELAHSLGATLGHGNHVVLVTGVTPGLGASVISSNLAAALARTESDTVLVCANLPSSYTARLFNLSPGPGLAEVLVHGVKLSAVVQTTPELPRLRVITPGHDEDLAWERLQTQSMDRLIDTLRRRASYVIIEAPPTSTSADAQALAEVADASIIVVEVPRAQRQHLSEAVRQLDRMGSAVLGSVVLPVQPGTQPPPPQQGRQGQAPAQPTPRALGPGKHGHEHAGNHMAPDNGALYQPPARLSGSSVGTGGPADAGSRSGSSMSMMDSLDSTTALDRAAIDRSLNRSSLDHSSLDRSSLDRPRRRRSGRLGEAYVSHDSFESGSDAASPGSGTDDAPKPDHVGEYRTQAFSAPDFSRPGSRGQDIDPDPLGNVTSDDDLSGKPDVVPPPAYGSDKFRGAVKPADNGVGGGTDRVGDP
jgi:capsular exopolysaccharide synthesis family protein